MKKSVKAAVVLALICIALGAAISLGALAAVRFDLEALNTMKLGSNTYDVNESFSHIHVEGAECTIRLLPSQTDACRVVCTEGDRVSHTVTVEEDTLTILHTDTRRWYEHIGIYWGEMDITVYLPARTYESLYLKTASGAITVPDGFSFSQAELCSVSGDIEYAADTENGLILKSTSGDLTVRSLTAGSLEARTTSGETAVYSTSVRGALTVQTVSGDVALIDVTAAAQLDIETASGAISLERSDAETLMIQSTSGDVSGTLLTGKQFLTHTASGDVRVPNSSASGGVCEVTTSSGEISLDYVN